MIVSVVKLSKNGVWVEVDEERRRKFYLHPLSS